MTTSVTTETRTTVPDPEPRPAIPVKPSPYLDAGRELFDVLDAIRDQMGLAIAVQACTELRTAARQSRIHGSIYGTPDGCIGCAYGTLGRITGFDNVGRPLVPGWRYRYGKRSPLENFVLHCHGTPVPEDAEVLAAIIKWCNQWEQDRARP